MKKTKLIFAIIMAILATTVAVVSCKKDDGNASSQKGYTVQQAPDIRQMEDPRSYMIDFKKKLTESKDNEAFNLEDAAWYLACLANLDFCNINVECDDFQFDTVEMQVHITDGIILLGDLSTAYEQMCTEIQQFKKGFNHYDQNLYYINVSIGAEGNAKIALMTSFTNASKDLYDHTWYFSDAYSAYLSCYEYFSNDSTYIWNGLAASELQRVLNLFEHYNGPTFGPDGSLIQCYFPTRDHCFYYDNSHDPYGSNFYADSRLFTAASFSSTPNFVLSLNDMCYCLDSYLGLGYDFIGDNLYYNEHPVNWTINCDTVPPIDYKWYIYYHRLHVEYGQPIVNNPPPGPNN
jgi:hypothetical protein